MFGRLIEAALPEIVHFLEIIGIIVITIGCAKTFVHYIMSICNRGKYRIRLELGNALALGLEFKMGAEILKTVLIHDMSEIMILGAIIILRALLALLLHFEIRQEQVHQLEDHCTLPVDPGTETE